MSKILVVVDMQNDFLTGSLANESAVAIIPNIKREIESGVYDHIIFTRDTHYDNYLETQEGKNLPVVHCVIGTEGWQVCDELSKSTSKVLGYPTPCVNKPTFGYDGWLKFISNKMNLVGNECEFTFTGTIASICVVSNALIVKSVFPDAKVRCIADCVAGFNEENKNAALEVMKSCQIEVIE